MDSVTQTCWDLLGQAKLLHSRMEDFQEGNLAERIKRFGGYVLQEVQISELQRGSYELDDELIVEYATESLDTIPPIILGEKYQKGYDVVDGNHRVESHALRGMKTIFAFVPMWETRIEDDSDEEDDIDG